MGDTIKSLLGMLRGSGTSWRARLGALEHRHVVALAALVREGAATERMGISSARTNIISKASGYYVKVGWKCFYVHTGRLVPTLEHALDIYAAAIEVKNMATARCEAEEGEPMTQREFEHLL